MKNTTKVSSSSPLKEMGIHIQEVAFLSLVMSQEVGPLLANKKSHYYSIKVNIKEYMSDMSIDN